MIACICVGCGGCNSNRRFSPASPLLSGQRRSTKRASGGARCKTQPRSPVSQFVLDSAHATVLYWWHWHGVTDWLAVTMQRMSRQLLLARSLISRPDRPMWKQAGLTSRAWHRPSIFSGRTQTPRSQYRRLVSTRSVCFRRYVPSFWSCCWLWLLSVNTHLELFICSFIFRPAWTKRSSTRLWSSTAQGRPRAGHGSECERQKGDRQTQLKLDV